MSMPVLAYFFSMNEVDYCLNGLCKLISIFLAQYSCVDSIFITLQSS